MQIDLKHELSINCATQVDTIMIQTYYGMNRSFHVIFEYGYRVVSKLTTPHTYSHTDNPAWIRNIVSLFVCM